MDIIGYEPLVRDMIWTLQWVGKVLQYYYQKGSLYRLRALGERHDMDIQWVGKVLQYYYQKGSLYRLRALGERHDMDITVGR